VIIATDAIVPTLKQTVLYLNSHSDLPVLAVELQRAQKAGVEVLVPNVFAASSPSPAKHPDDIEIRRHSACAVASGSFARPRPPWSGSTGDRHEP